MKEYNRSKWWIDSDIIRPIEVDAENVKDAMKQYRDIVITRDYIEISENALKHADPMYIDVNNKPRQNGFVITGQTEFEDRDRFTWSKQYIDLWVTIRIVILPDFDI